MPKSTPELQPIRLGVTEIAGMTGRTVRWVQNLAKDQGIEKDGRGKYLLSSVMAALVAHYEAILEKGAKNAAASRVTDARTREIELRIAERERALVPTEDAIMAIDRVVAVMNTGLAALPARLGRDMVVRRKAEVEVHAVRTKISDTLAGMADGIRTGRGLDEDGA